MFRIYDGREYFYQWDLDRKLIIEDPDVKEVHFTNRATNDAYVCETYVEDGKTLVNVPNILLQANWRIQAYAYDGKHTKHDKCYEVKSRSKPVDYVYTETEVLTWQELDERLKAVEEAQPASPESLEGKEDKANKVTSTSNWDYWWEYYLDTEKYPSMSTVSNGMIHMSNTVGELSNEVNNLKENSGANITVEHSVTSFSDINNPISVKGVYPIWEDVELLKFHVNTELEPVIMQATTARAFDDYEALVNFYDNIEDPLFLDEIGGGAAKEGYYTPIGSSMYIQTLNVPDIWVKDRILTSSTDPFCKNIKENVPEGMSLNEYIAQQLKEHGEFSIKWLTFAPLETQKVDLTNYIDKSAFEFDEETGTLNINF